MTTPATDGKAIINELYRSGGLVKEKNREARYRVRRASSPGEKTMPSKRELSQDEIQEIRSLRGQLSAAKAKKRFGIGSTRLYKIWRDEPALLEES